MSWSYKINVKIYVIIKESKSNNKNYYCILNIYKINFIYYGWDNFFVIIKIYKNKLFCKRKG